MILLKNNYFAWLWENKLCYKDLLVTDYDTDRERNGKLNIGDAFLKLEINLEPTEANEGEDEEENDRIDPSLYTNLLVKEGDPMYRDLQKKTDAALKRVRRVAKDNRKYKELKKLLQQAEEEDHQRDDIVDDGLVEHRKKRRKVLKSFREYTNPQDEEGKFKGWSQRAAEDMREQVNKLKIEGKRDKVFRMAYRLTYSNKQGGGKRRKGGTQESYPVNYEREIWGLEDIGETEL